MDDVLEAIIYAYLSGVLDLDSASEEIEKLLSQVHSARFYVGDVSTYCEVFGLDCLEFYKPSGHKYLAYLYYEVEDAIGENLYGETAHDLYVLLARSAVDAEYFARFLCLIHGCSKAYVLDDETTFGVVLVHGGSDMEERVREALDYAVWVLMRLHGDLYEECWFEVTKRCLEMFREP